VGNDPQVYTIAPSTMPKEDGGPIAHLKKDAREETIPTSSNRLPKSYSIRTIMLPWYPI